MLLVLLVPSLAPTPRALYGPHRRPLTRCPSPHLSDDVADDTDQTGLFASLRARTLQVEEATAERWRTAKCSSKVCLVLDNWIRRVAIDWPRAAVGMANGAVVVADLVVNSPLIFNIKTKLLHFVSL